MTSITDHQPFAALADPTRLRIVALLLAGELCVCDLVEVLGLPQSTVSRHMTKLKTGGLVVDRRDGRWVHYRLTDGEPMLSLRPYLRTLSGRDQFATDAGRLQVYLKEKKEKQC